MSSKGTEPLGQTCRAPSAEGPALQSAAESPSRTPISDALFDEPIVKSLVCTPHWKQALDLPNMRQRMQEHCVFCTQWHVRGPALLKKYAHQIYTGVATFFRGHLTQP